MAFYHHYNDAIMTSMTSQNTSFTFVYSGADQRKHQCSASLAFVRGIHRWPVNSLHKGPVTRKMFPFDDVIMQRTLFSRSKLTNSSIWPRVMRSTIFLLSLINSTIIWATFRPISPLERRDILSHYVNCLNKKTLRCIFMLYNIFALIWRMVTWWC